MTFQYKPASTYLKKDKEGYLVGKHPDELEYSDFPDTKAGFEAIRAKCLDCAYTFSEVKKCVQYTCPLWPFRMGRNPKSIKTNRGRRKNG